MQIGDLVVINNEVNPIIYIIKDIIDNNYSLKGYTHRSSCIVNEKMITLASKELIEKENNFNVLYKERLKKNSKERLLIKPLYGRILHIDGDKEYLNSCIELYKEIGVPAEGFYLEENNIKNQIEKLVLDITPEIIVITGHDIYNGKGKKDLNNYENTKNFIEALRIIRKHFTIENVCVIVGACGSHFEALIGSGANFASSPDRINIHTYDPAVIAIKVSTTSCNKNIDFTSCIKLIENGRQAFGGVETKGKMKLLL